MLLALWTAVRAERLAYQVDEPSALSLLLHEAAGHGEEGGPEVLD